MPQPKEVSITGAEGKKIEIKHNSPLVYILAIADKNGNLLIGDFPLAFAHEWKMAHIVEVK